MFVPLFLLIASFSRNWGAFVFAWHEWPMLQMHTVECLDLIGKCGQTGVGVRARLVF